MTRTNESPMNRVTVAYSDVLAEVFDRQRLALALHPALATVKRVRAEETVTRFQRIDEPVVVGDRTDCAVVQVEIATGVVVSEPQRNRLAQTVVEQVMAHLGATDAPVHIAVEVVAHNHWGRAESWRP
ncbi:tautomerase family protein [Streptomyces sp. N2-109]|uniref:Tautomerase family protein n=1 Tax=Streptomyces gossypii TaxID=2883101 RepID=A0ABT2JMH1_9ACTN|nr:tautomerase family protein [Streptomyces gossypii]MCT2589077.1 tautomerase family protein [Streptomyces gossypii]